MIESITKVFTKFFGKKSDRDVALILPIVELINAEYAQLQGVTNDELRAFVQIIRTEISNVIAADEQEIIALKSQAENLDEDKTDEQEALYKRIDVLKKQVLASVAAKLDEVQPKVFAAVKETAHRLAENSEIIYTANDRDRELARTKDFVTIEGDKAIYKNTWQAAGNNVLWNMIHYDVQLIGGTVLHQGKISEMATGEGKTLVATLPVFLNALSGKGVHLVTVNTYLSKRDAEWNAPLFEMHGIRVDCIDKHEPNSQARRNAYLADVTYGTNNEFGFDYLRDNMASNSSDLVQREHFYAIVDEVDSVLIDDARTPLIISGPTPNGDIHEFLELKPRVEFIVNAQKTLVNTFLADAKRLLAAGTSKTDREQGNMSLLRAHRAAPKNKATIKFLSEPSMRAELTKTEGFYIQDNNREMHLIDAELLYTIDEKNNSIELTEKGINMITGNSNDASFFILPDVGAQIVEIEKSSLAPQDKIERKDALMRDYSIKADRIHSVNQLLKSYTLFERDVEYVVMDNKIKIVDEQTGRILDGRRYSDGLHQAIEAKENVTIEAATQTYATVTLQNYFRMYHKLAGMTGTAETEAGEFMDIYKLDVVVIPTNRDISRKDSNDLVYKTKREKYNAVIEEVTKLVGDNRSVLVGTTSVEISELLSRMLKQRNIKHNVLNAKLHQKEAEIVASAGQTGAVTIATNMAGRGTDIKLANEVKLAGGLAIIGTERHDSRRVDRQLRGRAGRQGDPGSSRFFVSLEDDLMRMFGSDRISKIMDRMGLEEGEVIEHSMVTNSIERAQKKVEENNFGSRKRLLEYDDVMNQQREAIYTKRRHALFGEKLSVDISNMVYDVCYEIADVYLAGKDYEGFVLELIKVLSLECPISPEEFNKSTTNQLANKLYDVMIKGYTSKKHMQAEQVLPVVVNVHKNSPGIYENIMIPFTDGIKQLNVITPIQKTIDSQGREALISFEKAVILSMIDDSWKEHLRAMDELKQSVQNAVYEQKDPLLVYKFESFKLFKQMLMNVNREIVSFLVKAVVPLEQQQQIHEVAAPQREQIEMQTSREEVGDEEAQAPEAPKQQPMRAEIKIGRNDLCPCGSGKKYKSCHGVNV
ncbi:MAG: preprotein translocase subunit SecA [Bacteroidia bacterium]|nr:preprotein translocase subunit SecA [Bacteroidia bacterium]